MTDMAPRTPTDRPQRLPILPLRDVVVYPHTVIPLFVGRERSVAALDQAMARQSRDPARRPDAARHRRAGSEGHLRDRHARDDPAAAEAARRHRQGAGRGHPARAAAQSRRGATSFTAEAEELPEGGEQDRARDGRADALRHVAVRAVRQAQQEDSAGDSDFVVGHRFAGPARRYGRGADDAQAVREAEGARDRRRSPTARARARPHRRRDRHAADREAHPRPRQAADGEEPARVLPE